VVVLKFSLDLNNEERLIYLLLFIGLLLLLVEVSLAATSSFIATRIMKSSIYRFGSALYIVYIAFRVSIANLSPITDCDEVYNYWEPLHFILYGTGLQTWEYAPQYALRTYAYLIPMAGVAKSLQCVLNYIPPSLVDQLSSLLLVQSTTPSTTELLPGDNKPLLFALLRSFLALISCYSELSFINAIHDIGPTIAHWTAISSISAAGNFHSSQAYLPSSTVMILWRLSVANQMNGYHTLAILWGLVAVLAVGWPFCAVLFISTGCWALWKAGLCDFIKERKWSTLVPVIQVLVRTALHAIIIQVIVMGIDYYYYNQLVSPIWNIFAYNAKSGGDELYGIEPLSYYIKNLLLNFNLVAMLGVLSLPLLLLKTLTKNKNNTTSSMEILVLIPIYIWMAIVLPRPHKEERFLFPMYPALCFGAAVTTREVLGMCTAVLSSILQRQQRKKININTNLLLGLALLSIPMIISISRSFALHDNYTAPLAIYQEVYSHASTTATANNSNERTTYVCAAGEWYRFPSSFFLPPNHQLGFLKSSFTGQLPQPFTEFGSKTDGLSVQTGKFNDMNKEEMDRYVDISQCSYVIELVSSSLSELNDSTNDDTAEGIQCMKSDTSEGSWRMLSSHKYLDAEATPLLHRILYFPFGRDEKAVFKHYNAYVKEM